MHEITDDEKTWLMTLDKIYKYASDEELETIVHSIVGRLWEQQMKDINFITRKKRYHNWIDIGVLKPTDKELHKLAKGLRKPQ
jgi:environmental stress-induced protein Ves